MDTGYGYGRNVRIHKRSHGRNRSIGERPGSFHASPLRAVLRTSHPFRVRFTPKCCREQSPTAAAVTGQKRSQAPLRTVSFDHLVCAAKEREWNREAKRFGSFEIDV